MSDEDIGWRILKIFHNDTLSKLTEKERVLLYELSLIASFNNKKSNI